MGGAYSLDKAFRLKYYNICGEKIWFPQELPSPEEYRRAILNLQNAAMRVDYIITHTAPRTIIPRVIGAPPNPHDAELTGFLDWIYHDCSFSKWFCGHFHVDMNVNDQFQVCAENAIALF